MIHGERREVVACGLRYVKERIILLRTDIEHTNLSKQTNTNTHILFAILAIGRSSLIA